MPRPALIHSLRTWPGLAWAIPLLLLLCWPAAQAQPLLTLDPHPEQARRLGPDGQYWIDHTGRATPDEVMRLPDTAWQATRSDHIFPLHTLADMVWIRFRTAPIGSTHWHWYLEIPYANLDRATLFIQADDGRWTQQDAGDALPVAEWPLPHRQPLLQLRPKADAPVVHLLRVDHANPTSVPVLVTEERQLLRRERNVSVGLGVYFGIAALAVLVALSSAWRGRDLAFVLYALFTLLTALSAASLSGFAGLVLWPRHAAWNHHAATVLPLLTLGLRWLSWWQPPTCTCAPGACSCGRPPPWPPPCCWPWPCRGCRPPGPTKPWACMPSSRCCSVSACPPGPSGTATVTRQPSWRAWCAWRHPPRPTSCACSSWRRWAC